MSRLVARVDIRYIRTDNEFQINLQNHICMENSRLRALRPESSFCWYPAVSMESSPVLVTSARTGVLSLKAGGSIRGCVGNNIQAMDIDIDCGRKDDGM